MSSSCTRSRNTGGELSIEGEHHAAIRAHLFGHGDGLSIGNTCQTHGTHKGKERTQSEMDALTGSTSSDRPNVSLATREVILSNKTFSLRPSRCMWPYDEARGGDVSRENPKNELFTTW